MAVSFNVNVYGITGMGKKAKIGVIPDLVDEDAYYVGGTIFYIDSTATGATYHFYDQYGEEISDVAVGDSPYAYTVEGTPSKDKYYVFNPSAVIGSKRWTYYSNGEYVYNSLGTADGIGKGKTNTTTVMAADDGAYITNDSNGVATIWYELKQFRDNKVGNCDDWFIPSKAELEALRTAVDGEGNPLTTLFTNTYIWSSYEYSAQYAWRWYYNDQAWGYYYKDYRSALVAARGF